MRPEIILVGEIPQADRKALDARFRVRPVGGWPDPKAVTAAMGDVQVLAYRGHGRLDAAFMDLLPGLRLIANFGVGYDAIDVAAAKGRGIAVTNTPDVLSGEVADLAVGMMLAVTRDLTGGQEWLRAGKWVSEGPFPLQRRMHGKRVGIVGLGRIGAEIARRLEAFDMQIAYWSRGAKPVRWHHVGDLEALARQSDYLVIALAGGAGTAGLVTRAVIEALGPQGTLVNISRGTTVDEGALLDCLEKGKLGWAALDVFLNEPEIDPRFLVLNNVFLQPHVASATVETRAAMAELWMANMEAFFAGEALLTPVG
jgi:lactate dehydrogenase-like 2-hydroxyacid dehydrogenase